MDRKAAVAIGAVVVLVIAYLLWSRPAVSPLPEPTVGAPATPAEQIRKEEKPAEPQQSKEPASTTAAPAPPPAPQMQPLRPVIKHVAVTEGEDGRQLLKLVGAVELPAELARQPPPLLCVGKYPTLGTLVLDTGTVNGDEHQASEANDGWSEIGPERKSWPLIVLITGVPQAKTLISLDGYVTLIRRLGPGATGSWNLPADVGKSRHIGPATLKLAVSQQLPNPLNMPEARLMTYEVGALDKSAPGGMTLAMQELVMEDDPGPTRGSRNIVLQQLKVGPPPLLFQRCVGPKPPTAVRIVVPDIGFDRAPMRIENVEIPRNATMAAEFPIGPRGPREVVVDGFTVMLTSLTLSAKRQSPQLTLNIECTGPKKPGLVSFPFYISTLQAVTEAGDSLTLGSEIPFNPAFYQSLAWGGRIRSQKVVDYPKKPADRFVSLKGQFSPLLFGEQWAEAIIEIPPGDERPKIERDPITLDLRRQGKDLNITINIAASGMPGPEGGWWDAVTIGCRDSGGKDFSKEVRCIRMAMGRPSFATCSCSSPTGTVKVSVKYPVKGTKKDLPFEFKDVGLPRKGSVARPEKTDF